jgi:hypothetical protein
MVMTTYYELLRRRRAVHEAGHPATAFEVEIGVEWVLMKDEGGGYCEYGDLLKWRLEYQFPAWGRAYLLAMLGGIAAEERFAAENGLPLGPEHSLAWFQDLRVIVRAMGDMVRYGLIPPGGERAEIRNLKATVQRMVADGGIWAGINAIADELLLHPNQRVAGMRVEEVYRRHRPKAVTIDKTSSGLEVN